jgi:tetratricopeptide (TPR) repeat protein
MNKRVNVKAIVILTGGAVLLSAGVHFAHSFQVKRNAQGLSEQAALLEQEGKLGEATGYLGQYLGMVPDDTDALARLGLLLDQLAKSPRARMRPFFLLEQVLRRDGQRQEIRRKVARIATEIGRFADAKTHLDLLLQANPQDAELMQLQARCAAGERRPDDAAEWYRKALKLAPERLELHVEYAGLLRTRLEAPELANDRIAHMIYKNPESAVARLEGARYFRRFGDLDQAEKHVRYAMDKLGVKDAEMLLLAADVARARGKTAEARVNARRSERLVRRMHHPEELPQRVQTPPQPATHRIKPRDDEITAVYRDGVFVKEPGPAQGGEQAARLLSRRPRWRRLDKFAWPVVLASSEDDANLIAVRCGLTHQADGRAFPRVGEGDGFPLGRQHRDRR